MAIFGIIPPEPARHTDLADCAPAFATAVRAVLASLQAQGYDPVVYEAFRSDERQEWLYGFGRDYDDGRGLVTHAQTTAHGWHGYGLAADLISQAHGWDSSAFFDALQAAAETNGLTSGSAWQMRDRPHVQFGKCRTTPSAQAAQLAGDGNDLTALWEAVGAIP